MLYLKEKHRLLAKTTFKKSYESRNTKEGLLIHTDNGSNYVSDTFMNYLNKLGVTQSSPKASTSLDFSLWILFCDYEMKRAISI